MNSLPKSASVIASRAVAAGETRYVIVTPARNEAGQIALTIASVLAQTVRPVKWVIVDDGSTDGTAEIVERFASEHDFLELVRRPDRGFRKAGTGVMEAFYAGFERLEAIDWKFLVKLDADLSFEPHYFENCLLEFERDPHLGIAGGGIWHRDGKTVVLEETPAFHVRGATKIYRRACWEAIGGLAKATGWDTLDEVAANMLRWKTRGFPDLKLLHHRRTGQADGTWKNAVKNGRAAYAVGYHPLFFAVRCVHRLVHAPAGIESLGLVCGFAASYLRALPRIADKNVICYLRKQQMARLLGKESIWR